MLLKLVKILISDDNEKSETSKTIKNELVKQFSDSNNSWLKSKNSNSFIPEKGMCLNCFKSIIYMKLYLFV